jgi:paraquat-inducible protein B
MITRRGEPARISHGRRVYRNWFKRGIRAQLNAENLLTVPLYVDLDIHPNAPLNFVLEDYGGRSTFSALSAGPIPGL